MKSKLFKRGFLALISAQFFGAMNDNVLKGVLTFMVIDGAWTGRLGSGGQGIVGICFTIPFLFLSGFAGQVADRNSKRTVTLWAKISELPIALIALIGFFTGNLWITLGSLIALTCQSAFFGPAKYGMIPELVSRSDLSRANGAINMMTNIAVIAGTVAAGFISDAYNPLPGSGQTPELWLPGAALLAIAICGLVTACFIPTLPAGDAKLVYQANPFTVYIHSVRAMGQTRLLMVMMAWGYFYLLAGIAMFIVPEYTTILSISRAEAGVLLAVLGIAIGAGSLAAGLISGNRIEPRLIPLGAAGLTIFFTLLAVVPPTLPEMAPLLRVICSNVAFLLFGAGFSAGFYIIPLQCLLQKLSPDDERGRFLGTANGLSFAFLTVAALVYWTIRPYFGNQPQEIFYISAALMALGALFFLWKLRGTGVMSGPNGP